MKTTRIKDLPFYDTIAVILKKNNKEMTIETKYGIFIIGIYNRWNDVVEGDRIRLIKCVKFQELEASDLNLENIASSAYSLFEWKQNAKYKMSKKYITYSEAYWLCNVS